MSAVSLSASAHNRLLGAALLVVALTWALLFPLDGVLAWFVFGMVLGAGTAVCSRKARLGPQEMALPVSSCAAMTTSVG